MNDLITIT